MQVARLFPICAVPGDIGPAVESRPSVTTRHDTQQRARVQRHKLRPALLFFTRHPAHLRPHLTDSTVSPALSTSNPAYPP